MAPRIESADCVWFETALKALMHLTQQTDLGLRLLLILARGDGSPVSLPQCANEQRISYNHLSKVAQALTKGGYIETSRGRSGGVRLAKNPGEIRIGDVVRYLEPHMRLADCASCQLRAVCTLENLFCQALEAFLSTLNEQSLADLAAGRRA